jgi:DNA repair protein RadA/Sms
VLIGGDPGVGKSTLVLQAARKARGGRAAGPYVPPRIGGAGEDAPTRLGVATDGLLLWCESDLVRARPRSTTSARTLIVDSIQTVFRPS